MNIRNPLMTKAYAIAYVEYERAEDAEAAIAKLSGFEVVGHRLTVEHFDRSQQDHVNYTVQDIVDNEYLKALFLKGIDRRVTEDQLKQICEKFGPVQIIKLLYKDLENGVKISTGSA